MYVIVLLWSTGVIATPSVDVCIKTLASSWFHLLVTVLLEVLITLASRRGITEMYVNM